MNNSKYSPQIKEQLQKEFIQSICQTLKIDSPTLYTIGTIKDLTKFLQPEQYTEFLVSMFKRNNQYKKPMDILAEVVQEFNKEGKNELFLDIEEKAKALIKKVNSAFLSLEKLAHEKEQSLSVFLKNIKDLSFTSFRTNNKCIFTDKEIITLLEVDSFENWLSAFMGYISYSLDDLETKLILQMRTNRTKFYFEKKDINPTKRLQEQSKKDK